VSGDKKKISSQKRKTLFALIFFTYRRGEEKMKEEMRELRSMPLPGKQLHSPEEAWHI